MLTSQQISLFLEYMAQLANRMRDLAGQGGLSHDNGAGHTLALIQAYRAGQDGIIPSFWNGDFKDFQKTQDPEYKKYLELKKKFEG